jgi:hypothetical protein
VRVRWYACPDAESKEWEELACSSDAAPAKLTPFVSFIHNTVPHVHGLDYVDVAQIGPELVLHANGKLKPVSQRVLTAAVMKLHRQLNT